MAALLKNLLGNNARDRELGEEVRAALQEMRDERTKFEQLLARSGEATERLAGLAEPLARASDGADAALGRIGEVEARLAALEALSGRIQALGETADGLAETQARAQAGLAAVSEDSARIRTVFEELGAKMDTAEGLRARLEAFLEVEKPFRLLEGEASAIRGQIEATTEHLARLREQHDRLMDAHKLGTSKMEALDRRRDELGRDLTDKERRVVAVEHAVREMDVLRQSVAEVKRSMGSLKTLSDSVAQKASALEAQREAVDRALAQAEHLDRAMKQLDAGARQQQEQERSLAALAEQVDALRAQHQEVIERSHEIATLQRHSAEQTAAIRDQMAAATGEIKNAVERFDFESRGLESVSQRVADLRSALGEFEGRYRGLSESSDTVRDLVAQTQSLAPRLAAVREDAARIDEDVVKLHALRRDLDAAAGTTREIAERAARIESLRPAVEATLAGVERLGGTHAMVKDAIEQARLAHAELGRMTASQAETRTWLIETERAAKDLRERFSVLEQVTPTLAGVEDRTQRITASIAAIEARREALEDMHRTLAEVAARSQDLDERGRDLSARMAGAEERFVLLVARADEADRIRGTIDGVVASVTASVSRSEAVAEQVTAIEARCTSVDGLAERTRVLGEELVQRKSALDAAAADLARATELRGEAERIAEKLGARAKQLDAALAGAAARAEELDETASRLEDRAHALGAVDTRLGDFEQRLARWELTDQQVTRALDQIATRQATVQALGAELERMSGMAETTCENVRTITSAHREVAESRELLTVIRERLDDVRAVAASLDERERQMGQAEERLARAEGLLSDVRAGLETVHGQRTLVDQAVEKASALRFLLKHADAMIEGLREERKMTSDVQDAIALVGDGTDEEDGDEGAARAA